MIDGEKIGLYVDKGVQVPLDYACETIVTILGEGTNAPFCIAAAVAKAVEVVLDSLIDHQEFCNDVLSNAQSDAIMNDIINVHGDLGAHDTHLTEVNNQITSEFNTVNSNILALDNHLTAVDTHIANQFTALDTHMTNLFAALDAHMVTLIANLSTQLGNSTNLLNADLKQVMKLELTPEGQRRIVPAILTCDGSAAHLCPNVLTNCTGPSASCTWNNVGPLP